MLGRRILAAGSVALIVGCSPAASPSPKPIFQATVHPYHVPAGFVTLSWDRRSRLIHLALDTYGLATSSSHGTDLRQGPCTQADAQMVSTFPDITADAHGAVRMTLTSADSTSKPPDVHFDVLLGPGGASAAGSTRIRM